MSKRPTTTNRHMAAGGRGAPSQKDPDVRAELEAYLGGGFERPQAPVTVPLPDEPCVAAWRDYAAVAAASGGDVWSVLKARLPQFRFPVLEGMDADPAYRAAVRRGDLSGAPAEGLQLAHPDGLRLSIHPTLAGHIPVLEPRGRADFVALLQALTKRNTPAPIPDSMGACIIGGYNNWDRVARLRAAWENDRGTTAEQAPDAWLAHFEAVIVPDKPLYQDRFIVLSDGPYSGQSAADFGLDEHDWLAHSRTIRLEHECTHYFTRRVCGSMRNNIMDELIADYTGLVAAFGRFDSALFLRFLGIQPDGTFRPDGRLRLYRGEPPLSDPAFDALRDMIAAAARHLEDLHDTVLAPYWSRPSDRGVATLALTFLGLADLVASDAPARLDQALTAAGQCCQPAAGADG